MLALALLMLQVSLVSCTGNTYTGDVDGITAKSNAITFGGKTGVITRATGPEAAALLNNGFVVYGFKTKDDVPETVFDHYTVNYTAGSDYTTQSNSAGWEYVGQQLSAVSTLSSGAQQSIKYWDFSATQYDFIAFSKGTATLVNTTPTAGQVQFTPVDSANLTTAAYTITGAPADLAKVYIADRVTANKDGGSNISKYKDVIQFNFRSVPSQVRLGFYEIIPGYSVKDVEFYSDASTTPSTAFSWPVLTAAEACMPGENTVMTVKFPTTNASDPDFNRAHVSFAGTAGSPLTRIVNLEDSEFDEESFAEKENKEDLDGGKPDKQFLARTSSSATITSYTSVMPYEEGTPLTLKVNYTLVSTDGKCGEDTPVDPGDPNIPVVIPGETITVHGATAIIPAEFAKWLPNNSYTYLFKISDNTNGLTNPDKDGYAGLYPISFTAVVTQDDFGTQETVTTLAIPSITSYQKGHQVGDDANIAYSTGSNIYVCLENPNEEKFTTDNTRLLKVVIDDGALLTFEEYKRIKDAATMSEDAFNDLSYDLKKRLYTESYVTDLVANYIPSGDPLVYTSPSDAEGNKMTATVTLLLEKVAEIAIDDAPYGQAVKGNFMRFQPTEAGYYAFEYTIVCSTVAEYNGYHPKEPAIDQVTFESMSEAEKTVRFYKIIKVE